MADYLLEKNLVERVNIGDMLRRRARSNPDHTVLTSFKDGDKVSHTYSQLHAITNRIARGLSQAGIKQRQKVVIISENSPELIMAMFACYKLGVIAIPINYAQSIHDIRYNLEDSEACGIVFSPSLEKLTTAAITDNPHIKLRVSMGDMCKNADTSLALLQEHQSDGDLDDRIIDDRDVAHMIYTSGTTAKPKGVEVSHLSLYFSVLSSAVSLGSQLKQNALIVLPLFHCAALVNLYSNMNLGGTSVLQQVFDATSVLQILQSESINTVALLPTMWLKLVSDAKQKGLSFPHFNYGVYAMAPMTEAQLTEIRTVFSCKMHLVSGQTEFTPPACFFYDASPQENPEGNYWGVPGNTVDQAIIDDNGNEVPQGETGEICWRGPQVMNGYYGDVPNKDDSFRFGWLHSGDLGRIDNYGQLEFMGRKKDIIKSGGENVSAVKVENAVLRINGITAACAFGVPHESWFEAVCVAVIKEPDSSLSEVEIINHCKDSLGRFETPKKIIFVDELPLTGTGKVKKNKLVEKYLHLFKKL